jgi:hypothetical protein
VAEPDGYAVPEASLCHRRAVDDRDDTELAELGALLRKRNALDARIGRLLDRPVKTGSIGEWIAARIFDVELETAANTAGYDGRFTTAGLAGRTVNSRRIRNTRDCWTSTRMPRWITTSFSPGPHQCSPRRGVPCGRSAFRLCSFSTRTDSTSSSGTVARRSHSDERAQKSTGGVGRSVSAIQQPTVGPHPSATSPA